MKQKRKRSKALALLALQKDTVAFHSIWDVWAGCLEEGIVVRARVRGFENRPRTI